MVNAIQFYDDGTGYKILFGDKDGNNTDKIAFSPDCCCDVCTACKAGIHPDALTGTLAGIADDYCDDCTTYNDDFPLDLQGPCEIDDPGTGRHSAYYHYGGPYEGPGLCEGYFDIYMGIHWMWNGEAGRRAIFVNVMPNSNSTQIAHFILDQSGQSEPFDCAAFSGLDIPYDSTEGLGLCDFTSATFKLTTPPGGTRILNPSWDDGLIAIYTSHKPGCRGGKVLRGTLRERLEKCQPCDSREGKDCLELPMDQPLAEIVGCAGRGCPLGRFRAIGRDLRRRTR